MNQNKFKNVKGYLVCILLVFRCSLGFGVIENYTGSTKSLKTFPLVPAAPLYSECYDSKKITTLPFTGYSANWNQDFNFKYIHNSVKVSIDRSGPQFYNTASNIRVKLIVWGIDANGNDVIGNASNTTPNVVLDLTFDPAKGVVESDKAVFAFENAVWFKATVFEISDFNNLIISPLSSAYPDVLLETTLEFDRIYRMDLLNTSSSGYSAFASSVSTPSLLLAGCSDKTGYQWGLVDGAEEWEIEWVFIEYHSSWASIPNASSYLINPANCEVNFRNNATRMRISKYTVPVGFIFITPTPYFEIPTIYESGFVVFRVRPIGRDINTFQEIVGPWSMADKTSGNNLTIWGGNKTYINNYNEDINWQRNVNFAEEGKFKNVISYFDGALRNRQSITLNNSDNVPIVGQTIYDHVGRPTIQVLPTPALDNNSGSCFREKFNKALGSSSEYGFLDFDLTSDYSCPGSLMVAQMDAGSGAAKYYSPNGYNSSMQPWQAFVPDANGYPFAQIEYTPDNTGRIARQGGVGQMHRLTGVNQVGMPSDGKETKFLYGKPFQEQLWRLFGSEVGNAEHYKRHVVVDANGQVSVTYIDAYGRTVATALAGDPANTPNLTPLPSSGQSFNYNIKSFNNKSDNFNHSKVIEHTITVIDAGVYTIDYTVDPIAFTQACTPEGICYDCVYDMRLSLTNDCGVEMIPTDKQSAMVGNVQPFDLDCNAVTFELAPAATGLQMLLQPGTYRLLKTLTVNKEALDYYKEKMWEHNTCLKTFDDFLQEEKAKLDLKNKCIYLCDDCQEDLTKLNDRKVVLTNLGENRTEAENAEFLGIDHLIEEQTKQCAELCNDATPCQVLLNNILSDVSPYGQYAEKTRFDEVTQTEVSALTDAVNLLNDNPSRGWNNGQDWRHPLNPHIASSTNDAYYNEDGTEALIEVINNYPEISIGKDYYDKTGAPWSISSVGSRYIKPQDLKYVEDFIKFFRPSWAYSLMYYHPEYCYYEKCKYIEPTYQFDQRMLAEDDAAEALKKGYYNPLNFQDLSNNGTSDGQTPHYYSSSEVTNMLDKDPLFSTLTLGLGNKVNDWYNHMYNYSPTGVNNGHLSIWDIYNNSVSDADLTPEEIACVGDAQWSLLRSLYISAKFDLLKDYYLGVGNFSGNCTVIPTMTDKCKDGSNCVGVSIPSGKLVRFPLDATGLNQQLNFDPATNGNTFDNGKSYTESQIADLCEERCESYKSYWITQLEKCNLYGSLTNTEKEAMIDDLEGVCLAGCDENNLLGAREVPLYRYKDLNGDHENFYKVFEWHLGINKNNSNWFSAGICDDIIIEWPMDYNHDYSAYDGPFSDTCACNKKDYAVSNPNCTPNEIPAPLNSCACDIKDPELRYSTLMNLDIPQELKCQNCVDCKRFNEGYSAFIDRYGKTVVNNMSDEVFEDLVYKWMNLYLGFNLTYQDYLAFAGQCAQISSAATRETFDGFEVIHFSKLDRQNAEMPGLKTNHYDNELFLVERSTRSLWDELDVMDEHAIVKPVEKVQYGQSDAFENDLIASADNDFFPAPVVQAVQASADAERLACNCEKLLTARWYTQNRNSENLSDLERYNQMFGSQPFGSQANFDNAYKVCCNAYNNNIPAIPDCNSTDFVPGSKFTQAQTDYFDQQVLGNQNSPVITSSDYQSLYDNNCSNPLQANNNLQRLDKCACEKLMAAKNAYILLYGTNQYNTNLPNPSFDAYIYQQHGVSGADFKKLAERCSNFWESGSGVDNTGAPNAWPGMNATWKKISLKNLDEDAKDEDLQVPEGLLCGPPPPPPCQHYLPSCMTLKYILSEFLKTTTLPTGMDLGNPYGTSDPNYSGYVFYGGWERFYEAFMDYKSSSSPDPAYTAFFQAFADFANSHQLVKHPCPTPAGFSFAQLIQSFKGCYPEPCKPTCKDFQDIFNVAKVAYLNTDPRPVGFDENTTLQDFYSLAMTNYYTDATTRMMADYIAEAATVVIRKRCPKQNQNVEYGFHQIWNMMWTCFSWPILPDKPPVLPPKCTTCYSIDFDYLQAFQNFLNQINLGRNTYTPTYAINQLNYDDWLLINSNVSPPTDVTEFYNSILYAPLTSQSTLRYRMDEDSYGVPYLEVNVKDGNGFDLGFTLEFQDNEDEFNYGYIKEFRKIKPIHRIGCGLAKSYEVEAEIIIPPGYPGAGTPRTIKMIGSFTKGGYASFTNCWDTCVRLCNRPQIPAPTVEDDPCETELGRIAYSNAIKRYEDYKKEVNAKFEADYIAHCMGVNEHFGLRFNSREYHYTLYYYDQVGNLIKTVPPEGVDITNPYMTKTYLGPRGTALTTNALQQDFGDERIEAARLHKEDPLSNPRAVTSHSLITNYKYNTLNQLIWQSTPDGGESRFWYDNLGRLVVSQNAKQLINDKYSYTIYDGLGRIVEVGEKTTSSTMDYATAGDYYQLDNFLGSGTNRQVTRTFYDVVDAHPVNGEFTNGTRQYLRQRVVSSHYFAQTPPSSIGFYKGYGSDAATHYSYDIHGNVNEMVQELNGLSLIQQQYKKITYRYDLLSGKMNEVHYQPGKPDQMHHRYTYDADNRLTKVETSVDNWNYTLDAKYFYYLHGPLARIELGDYNQKVQGLDYAYTLHGWLKSVNGAAINPDKDMGKDGNRTIVGNSNKDFGRDAFGFMLHYYDGDYSPVGGGASNFMPGLIGSNVHAAISDLYNGNIPFMQTSLPDVSTYNTNGAIVNSSMGNVYQYDQLNRIVQHKVFENFDNSSHTWLNTPSLTGMDNYYEQFEYDANGNILSLQRHGENSGTTMGMDNFSYRYNNDANQLVYPSSTSTGYYIFPMQSNKLYHVNDAEASSNYTDDIDDQGTFNNTPGTINTANNYGYDEIGNLIRDDAEEIAEITWNVYGKIESITRANSSSKPDLEFTYSASGQRISKTVKPRASGVLSPQKDWVTTWYVKDALGNVMATYSQTYQEIIPNQQVKEEIKLKELHLYGSSRLGIYNSELIMATQEYSINGYTMNDKTFVNQNVVGGSLYSNVFPGPNTTYSIYKGRKQYELSNHLGNVLATISDRRILRDDNGDLIIDYFNSDILSTSDYYVFGSSINSRKIFNYYYGFNGKGSIEKEKYDFGARIYDSRIARFYSIDPMQEKLPFINPYNFAWNQPIWAIDFMGELRIVVITTRYNADGTVSVYRRYYDKTTVEDIKGITRTTVYVHRYTYQTVTPHKSGNYTWYEYHEKLLSYSITSGGLTYGEEWKVTDPVSYYFAQFMINNPLGTGKIAQATQKRDLFTGQYYNSVDRSVLVSSGVLDLISLGRASAANKVKEYISKKLFIAACDYMYIEFLHAVGITGSDKEAIFLIHMHRLIVAGSASEIKSITDYLIKCAKLGTKVPDVLKGLKSRGIDFDIPKDKDDAVDEAAKSDLY